MFQELSFSLIHDCKKIPTTGPQNGRYHVSFPAVIEPRIWNKRNLKSLKAHYCLEIRLREQMPTAKWGLTVSFAILKSGQSSSTVSDDDSDSDEENENRLRVNTLKLSVKGKILQKLHSVMTYDNPNARLKVRLQAKPTITSPCHTEMKIEAELLPRHVNGKLDHSYYASNISPATKSIIKSKTTATEQFEWNIGSMCLSIEGLEYDKAPLEKILRSYRKEVIQSLMKTGLGCDVTIRCKFEEGGDHSPIYFSGNILFSQSSVIKAMFNEGKFNEGQGSAREIFMMERTREEVEAFLAFLYFGDLASAINCASVAVGLYEMGDYYDAQMLKEATKEILLSTSVESFGCDEALRLFHVSGEIGDMQLRQMAVDILKMCTDDEITNSSSFDELAKSGTALTKELFLMSRKF